MHLLFAAVCLYMYFNKSYITVSLAVHISC